LMLMYKSCIILRDEVKNESIGRDNWGCMEKVDTK
jgi:hypothetical protein